jgi:hypothetical protein
MDARIGTVVTALLVAAALPAAAQARTVQTSFALNQRTPLRVWDETAGLPFLVAGPALTTRRYRLGTTTYTGVWVPSAAGRLNAGEGLAELFRGQRWGSDPTMSVVVDRPLTAAERRRVTVVADLARDADVLVVAAGHPACAGITRAAARALVAGRVTRWEQVVAGGAGAIALRYPVDSTGFAIPRMGVPTPGRIFRRTVRYAPAARPARDGGLSVVRAGDPAAVALTSWSRARGLGGGACLVPVGGVAPTAETVASLRYPEAYPLRYVMARPRAARVDRGYVAVVRRETARVLTSEAGRAALRARGLWVVGDPPPATAPPTGPPAAPAS